jgi:hypothetical protein
MLSFYIRQELFFKASVPQQSEQLTVFNDLQPAGQEPE